MKYLKEILLSILWILPISSFAQTDFSSWAGHVEFKISTEAEWANINATVYEFPVLVQFGAGFFDFSTAKGQGDDIRFASESDIPLPFEIEQWDSTSGRAAVWVLLDSLSGASSMNIRMYFGNPTAVSLSNSNAVFDTSKGFSLVYHLNENPESGSFQDGTANGFNGSANGNMTVANQISGIGGWGVSFDGTDDFIQLDPLTNSYAQGLTLCGWVKPEALKNWARMIDVGNAASQDVFLFSAQGETADLRFELWNGTATTLDVTNYWDVGEWNYSCGVWDGGTNMIAYKNGGSVGTLTTASAASLSDTSRSSGFIGKSNWPLDDLFQGSMDEIQISHVPRSSDWIALAYQNQKPGQTLVSLPIKGGTCSDSFFVLDSIVVSEGREASISAIADCALRIEWIRMENGSEISLSSSDLKLDLGAMPLITSDSSSVYRFKALFESGWQTRDVTLVIKNDLADPEFQFVSPIADGEVWNGFDTVVIGAQITNQDVIDSLPPPYNSVTLKWGFYGDAAISRNNTDTTAILNKAFTTGNTIVEACLEYGGLSNCDSLTFTIEFPPPLLITKPSLQEELEARTEYEINWSTTLTGSVFLHYSLDSGANWTLIDFGLPNSGTYTWTVPDTSSEGAKVRVSAASGNNESESEYFTIKWEPLGGKPNHHEVFQFFVGDKLVYQELNPGIYNSLSIRDFRGKLVQHLRFKSNKLIWKKPSTETTDQGVFFGILKGDHYSKIIKFVLK